MKQLIVLVFMVIFAVAAATQQRSESEEKSARKMVEDFWKMETAGGRLTQEGWDKSAIFFVNPAPMPVDKVIAVVHKNFSVSDAVINCTRAEVKVNVLPQGRIDSSLRFTPSEAYKAELLFHLILTDEHLGRRSVPGDEVRRLKWRIEGPNPMEWITVDTAITYVREMRDHTRDPVVRENADRTLATLMSSQ